MEREYLIQEVARIAQIPASTIRYYESEGLFRPVKRDLGGVRKFRYEEVEWLTFLGKLREMEMPITKMKRYAELREKKNENIPERILILKEHQQIMEERIKVLEENIQLLRKKIILYQEIERSESHG